MMKEESNETHVKCRCNHLTNFAILMDIHGVDKLVIFDDIITLSSLPIMLSLFRYPK